MSPEGGRPADGGSGNCSDDDCIIGINRCETVSVAVTVKGNGIDASDVCTMCKREIGNVDSEGSKQPYFRYNGAATESEQSFCDPKKHPLRQYRAGPFVIPMSLQSKEIMLLEYIMNEDLDKW